EAALGAVDEEKAAEGEKAPEALELAAGRRREAPVAGEIQKRRVEELLLPEGYGHRVVARHVDRGADGKLGAEALQARRPRRGTAAGQRRHAAPGDLGDPAVRPRAARVRPPPPPTQGQRAPRKENPVSRCRACACSEYSLQLRWAHARG